VLVEYLPQSSTSRRGAAARPHRQGEPHLLPLTDEVLDPESERRLAVDFKRVAAEQGPAASIERAEAATERLTETVGAATVQRGAGAAI